MLDKVLLRLKFVLQAGLSLIHLNFSFSQEGEDMVLSKFFPEDKNDGFFIDVGCFHPVKYSNTYKFYLLGWHGINIDATPSVVEKFNKKRKRDINLRAAISDKEMVLKYHYFNHGVLNTLSEEMATAYISNPRVKLLGTEMLTTRRLENILDEHVPNGTNIDFMSIDVEGHDFQVLQSNNWTRYRPNYLIIENHKFTFKSLEDDEIGKYLLSNGYEIHAKLSLSIVYKKVID